MTLIEIITLGIMVVSALFALFLFGVIGWVIYTYLHIAFFIAYILIFVIPIIVVGYVMIKSRK